MNENGRKRTSKWDLIDGKRNLEDTGRENVRPGNYRALSDEYRSYFDSKYPTHSKDVRSKFEPTVSARDHASGNQGTRRENSLDRVNRGFSEAGTNWDEDGTRRDHDRSPRSSWKRPLRSTSRGRSRSRSPVRAYRHESRDNETARSKPEVPIQTCRDFTSGRCRRGSHCPFLHPSTQNFEDRRYDFQHREESIRGGKYSHHRADGDYNDYNRESFETKREYDRNSRGTAFNHGMERGARRSADTPCTFFAAGNCRNGKFCRFSHHIPSSGGSGVRAHDERGRTNHSPEKTVQLDRGTEFSDTANPHDPDHGKEEKRRTNHSPDRVDRINQGLKNSEASGPRDVEYGKENYGKVFSPESRSKVVSSSSQSEWSSNIGAIMDKVGDVEPNKSSQWKTDSSGNITSTSELKGVDNWMEDKMSPEWNPKVSSGRTLPKEEPAYAIQASESVNYYVPSQPLQLLNNASTGMPDVAEKPNFQPRFNSTNDPPSAFSYDRNVGNIATRFSNSVFSDNSAQPSTPNIPCSAPGVFSAVGQGQFSLTPNHPGAENTIAVRNSTVNCEDTKTCEAISGATTASGMVRQEQLAQLTDLSASLVHLLGKGQPLPQLYAAMNPPNQVSSVEISNGLVCQFPVETGQPYPPIGPGKPYEPVQDNAVQPYPPNPGMLRTSEDVQVQPEIPSAEQNAGEAYKNGYAEDYLSSDPDTDSKPNQKPQTIPEERTKGKDKHAKSRECSSIENMDGEGKVDRGEKVKDTKALRDFKHALVNFVKELLKPAWKDGQIDKEDFKTIVKKVVDKVTAAIQEANIPQTPEKVEQYLSASKPKLTKLVQAYVDRTQKKQT